MHDALYENQDPNGSTSAGSPTHWRCADNYFANLRSKSAYRTSLKFTPNSAAVNAKFINASRPRCLRQDRPSRTNQRRLSFDMLASTSATPTYRKPSTLNQSHQQI